MLTAEEYTAAKAALTTADTERAAIDQAIRDAIEKAREYNDQTRALRNKITAIDRATAGTRAQVTEYEVEQKRLLSEQRRAQAAAAAEAKAKEVSELAQAQAKIADLESQLAAKG